MSRSYNDIKDFLYAWLGKHSIKPEYQLSQCAESSKKVISFECRLFVPGFSFDCTAVGQSKKQAMTNAARKFCQLLIKQGLLGRLELRHAVPILDFEISHRDDMTEVKQPPSYNHFPTKSEMSLTSSHNLSGNNLPAVTTSNISQKSDNHEQMDTDDIGDVLLRTESSLTFTPTATNSNSARETFIPTNDIELISARALLNQYFTRINFHHKHVFNITVSGPIHKPTFTAKLSFVDPQCGKAIEACCDGPRKQLALAMCAQMALNQLKSYNVDYTCSTHNLYNLKHCICSIVVSNDLEVLLNSLKNYSMNAFYTQSDLLRMLINKQNVNVICWSPPFCNFNPWRHCLLSEDNIGYQQSLSQISNYVFERRYNDRFKVSNKLILEQMNLPIKAYHNDIIQQCLNNQLLLIRGETGCGKSTQVAQYILDYFVDNGMGACCNILISEPRRLATLAISQRIAAERGEIVGETVGFRHRFESVLPRPYGSILVSTIGCALRRLKYGLNGISHVIIDEAHDNDADSLVLMSIMKTMLLEYPELRVIVMSASFDTDKLSKYFNGAPTLFVNGRAHDVDVFFLDDFKHLFDDNPINDKEEILIFEDNFFDISVNSNIEAPTFNSTSNTTEYMYENRKLSLSYSKLLKLLYHIHHCVESKSILIFLSGWFMISSVYNLLKKDGLFGSNAYEVLRLHSHQPTQSISQIFDDVPLNIRRIILSTNIAESSITVNGVGVVIDTCTTRLFKSFDGLSIPSFITTWASKSQLEQRKGRTGRTMKGICYRFLSRLVYNRLPSFHSAALHSANIEDMYLKLKFLKLVNPSKIFNNLIEPPSSIAISNAIDALKQLNALDTVGELTNVGSFMGYFPLPPVLSKLVLIGYFLGISRPMATIVATLESREPYAKQTIFSDFIQEHKNKLCDGDHWLMYNFVKYFEQKNKVLCANKDRSSGVGVCESKIINIINSRDQILNILHKHSSSLKYFVTEEQDETKVCQLISSAMCMGFFQNVCVHYKQKSFKLRNEIIHALFNTKATKYNMIVQNWKYFVFSEKVKMSGLFARAISPITPMQMLSMNNVRLTQLPIDQPNSSSLACCYDNWLNFSLTPNVLESCIAVRSLIEYMLNNISTLWLDNNCYFTRTKESQNTDYCEYIHNLRLHTDSFPLFALRICLAMMSDRSDQQVIYQLSENPLVTKYHQQCKDQEVSNEEYLITQNFFHDNRFSRINRIGKDLIEESMTQAAEPGRNLKRRRISG